MGEHKVSCINNIIITIDLTNLIKFTMQLTIIIQAIDICILTFTYFMLNMATLRFYILNTPDLCQQRNNICTICMWLYIYYVCMYVCAKYTDYSISGRSNLVSIVSAMLGQLPTRIKMNQLKQLFGHGFGSDIWGLVVYRCWLKTPASDILDSFIVAHLSPTYCFPHSLNFVDNI